jgi:5-methylcytosine-specific restriction endonuclease McrA
MAKPNPRTKNGHRRRELRRWWKAQGLPCALCGQPIDYDLPAGNPLSFEVDEIIPVSLGGDPLSRENTQPAHRICNERKGNGTRQRYEVASAVSKLERTRDWGF